MINLETLQTVQEAIALAEKRACREKGTVKLMAVSKTQPVEAVLAAKDLGLSLFGENRVIEGMEKFQGLEGVELHLIGQLQSNKVAKAVSAFDLIQSVDSVELAEKIAFRALQQGKIQRIYLEQNCSNEASKSGFESTKALFDAVEKIRTFDSLSIEGLMTIAPFTNEEKAIRRSFSLLRSNFEQLQKEEGLTSLQDLSMGMSGDFIIAIEEGSTLVRIGTALFGVRSYPTKLQPFL